MKKLNDIIISEKTPNKNSAWCKPLQTGGWELCVFTGKNWEPCISAELKQELESINSLLDTFVTFNDFNEQFDKTIQKEILFGEEIDYSIIAGKLRLYTKIPFASGSVEILPQDVLVGAVSEASYEVHAVVVESGDWETGDATGYIIIKTNNSYLDDPFTDEETLLIGEESVAIRTTDTVTGCWVLDENTININNVTTTTTNLVLTLASTPEKIITFTANADSSFSGYNILCNASVNELSITIEELSSDLTTGAVSGVSIDFTNINNCGADGFISVFGIIKNNNE